MTRRSTAPHRVFSASQVLDTLGDALGAIKREDRLTFADLGAVLGKSEDQAAKYADGTAEMGVVAFARGLNAWGSRLGGPLMRLVDAGQASGAEADLESVAAVSRALNRLAESLADDGVISIAEITRDRAAYEDARDAIDALLRRLGDA